MINPAKCLWAKSSVPFLGHDVTAAGVTPLDRHVEAVQSFPQPGDVKALQRFLGVVNFFRRFIRSASAMLALLTDALKLSPKEFTWTPSMATAFSAAKEALASAAVLRHPDPAAAISLAVDASTAHIGGMLQQWDGGVGMWAPLGFWSKKLTAAEKNYSVFDKELLAVYSGIRHFRFALEGRPFRLFTDHRPIVSAMTRVTLPISARQQRQLSFISEFQVELEYLPGESNVVADAMSRPTAAAVVSSVESSSAVPQCFVNSERVVLADLVAAQ